MADLDDFLKCYNPKKNNRTSSPSWIAPDGTTARLLTSTLHIQSKAMNELAARVYAELESKRKAVPNF